MMILTALQIVALLATAYKLASFDRHGKRYKFGYSLAASCWAGACLALAVAMLLSWPHAVEATSAITASVIGASLGLAWASGGNVAKVGRWLNFKQGAK